jgi:hypothetical protein
MTIEPIRYYVTAGGVTVECYDKDNVLEWVNYMLDKGLAPTVDRVQA